MSPRGFDPALDATIEFSPRAPGIARRAVEELAADVDAGILRNALLLVSEIVTNSVKHSGSDEPIRLRAWARQSGLKVEITDGGFGFETELRKDAGDDEGGRGLLILEAVADRWGVIRDARARVWFELSPRPLSRSARAG